MQDSNLMTDLRERATSDHQYGDDITFTGFNRDQSKELQGRIDFMWLGPTDSVGDDSQPPVASEFPWAVQRYATVPNVVLPDVFEDGIYSSDHRAAVGDVNLLAQVSAISYI